MQRAAWTVGDRQEQARFRTDQRRIPSVAPPLPLRIHTVAPLTLG